MAISVLTDTFNLMPGLVIDFLGGPAVIVEADRDIDREINHLTINTPTGDHEVALSWSGGQLVRVIGLAVHSEPDNISLWDE